MKDAGSFPNAQPRAGLLMIAIVTTNSTLAAQDVHVLNSAHTLARLTRASVLGMLSARDVHVLTSANTLARLTHASVLACQTVVWSAQYVHVLWFCLVWSGLISCGLVWSGLVWFGPVWSGSFWLGLVGSGLVWFGMVWSRLVWFGLVSASEPTQSYPPVHSYPPAQ